MNFEKHLSPNVSVSHGLKKTRINVDVTVEKHGGRKMWLGVVVSNKVLTFQFSKFRGSKLGQGNFQILEL